jgi:broad specificity phosphatase PhoE
MNRCIALVRHGEPAASWGADADPGLSAFGHQQARAIADRFGDDTEVWTSPMRRCRETAAPLLARLGREARIVPEVSEIPAPEGQADPRAWLMGVLKGRWNVLGAELQAWRRGVLAGLAGADPSGPRLVVFTHFIAINSVVSYLQADPRVMAFQPGHASVTELSLGTDGLSLVSLGQAQPIVLT